MCVWGSSFYGLGLWFMGIIGGSTRANRPNRLLGVLLVELLRKNMGGRLIGHGRLIGIIRYMNTSYNSC